MFLAESCMLIFILVRGQEEGRRLVRGHGGAQELAQVLRDRGARPEGQEAPLRQRGLNEGGDVGLAVAHRAQAVGHPQRLHVVPQDVRELVAWQGGRGRG